MDPDFDFIISQFICIQLPMPDSIGRTSASPGAATAGLIQPQILGEPVHHPHVAAAVVRQDISTTRSLLAGFRCLFKGFISPGSTLCFRRGSTDSSGLLLIV